MSKFTTGDRVRIVNYGHLMWIKKEQYHLMKMKLKIFKECEDDYWCDIYPEKIGKEYTVGRINTIGTGYEMLGFGDSWCWADKNQLELVVND